MGLHEDHKEEIKVLMVEDDHHLMMDFHLVEDLGENFHLVVVILVVTQEDLEINEIEEIDLSIHLICRSKRIENLAFVKHVMLQWLHWIKNTMKTQRLSQRMSR